MDEYSGGRMFGYGDETEKPVVARHVSNENQPKPEQTQKLPSATELLVWIRRRWNRPTISLREIQVYGPHSSRDHATAVKHTATLEKHGWLAPMKAHRRDRRVW